MRRRGPGSGWFAAAVVLALGATGASGTPAVAVTAPAAPAVVVGCLGVDPGATGPQIRVGLVVSGPDGLYRAVLAGPSGPVQGEGRVAGGRGLVIVPTTGRGDYDDLVLTDVDTGQAVERGPLDDALPLTVGDDAIACDPAALVAPPGAATPEAPTAQTAPTAPAAPAPTTPGATADVPTPDISTAAPLTSDASSSEDSATSDAPPWLLLAIPGALLVTGGLVLLIRARSGSRSRPAT